MRHFLTFTSCALAACSLLPASLSAQVKSAPVTLASTASPRSAEASAPVPAKPGAYGLSVGSWACTMPIPGKVISVGLVIGQQGSGLSGVLDIPGGSVRQRPLQVSVRSDTVRLQDATLGVLFTCSVSPDGQLLSGSCSWAQLGLKQPVTFHRGVASAAENAQRVNHTAYSTKWENGAMENDRPVGPWNYYRLDAAGDYVLIRTYDHTDRRLVFARPESEAFDAEVRPGVWERTILTQSPWFIGRHDALTSLGSQLSYPSMARSRRVEGKVYVTFAVDTLGRVSDHRILRGLGYGCDEEALRVARTIPDTWTPARLGTKAVAARQTLMFAFKLQ